MKPYVPRVRTILFCFMLPDLQLTVDFSGPFWTEISPACWVHLHGFFASAVGSTQAATLEEK